MPHTLSDLLLRIAGQDTEYDGSIVSDCQIHDSSSRLTTYIVEMRSRSTDDDTDSDDEIIFSFCYEFLGKCWYLECSWNEK